MTEHELADAVIAAVVASGVEFRSDAAELCRTWEAEARALGDQAAGVVLFVNEMKEG